MAQEDDTLPPKSDRPGTDSSVQMPGSAVAADLVFYAALAGWAVAFLFFFATAELCDLVSTFADGSGYYLQTARNAARGEGVTLDGIHPTNGFHPLWMAVLVGVFAMVRGTSDQLYRLVGFLDIGLIVVAAVLFHRTLRGVAAPDAALAGGMVYVAFAFRYLNLMEMALALATTSALFLYSCRYRVFEAFRVATSLGFGLLLGLVILARLDLGFLAISIGVAGVLRIALDRERRRDHVARLSLVVAGSSLLVLPYLLYNQLAFGSAMPVSGRLESTFPHPGFSELVPRLQEYGRIPQAAAVVALGYLAWYVLRRSRATSRRAGQGLHGAIAVVAAAFLVHLVQELLFMQWPLYWHLALLPPLLGAVTGTLWPSQGPAPAGRATRIAGWVVLAAVVVICGRQAWMRAVERDEWQQSACATARWARSHTAQDAVFAARKAEVAAFLSDRQVVDLSGFSAGYELHDAIRDGALASYLAQSGVQYILAQGVASGGDQLVEAFGSEADVSRGRYEEATLRYRSLLYDDFSDPVRVRREDEVYRTTHESNGKARANVVWRVRLEPEARPATGH